MDGYECGWSGWGMGQVGGTCYHDNETSGFIRCGEFLTGFLSKTHSVELIKNFWMTFQVTNINLL